MFLPADPPREGRLALYGEGPEEIELALPAGSAIRRKTVPARLIPIGDALPELLALPRDGTDPALAAWASAATAGVGLVARGRLLPTATPAGYGAWRAGPLDPADARWLAELTDAMPAHAHALPVAGAGPLRIRSPQALVRALWDAIADVTVRTAAAARASTAPAFAAREPVETGELTGWLAETDAALAAGARPVLRVEPPGKPDEPFAGMLALRSIADLLDTGTELIERLAAAEKSDLAPPEGLHATLAGLDHPAQYLHEDGPLPSRSGKLTARDELLDVILDAGDSVLVFSPYVQMCRLVQAHLTARGVPTLFLHGGVSAQRREQMVADFQDGAAPVLLLSIKAGGVGLNLTRASHVIHYDRWWNPTVEDQATDRAYRIGQQRAVQVHKLVTEGTVEDRIATLLSTKREPADAVVGAGESWITELSNTELADLVRLGSPS